MGLYFDVPILQYLLIFQFLIIVVNFINILRAPFAPKKMQSQNIVRANLHKALSYKKRERKMLMKLTPGWSSIVTIKTRS